MDQQPANQEPTTPPPAEAQPVAPAAEPIAQPAATVPEAPVQPAAPQPSQGQTFGPAPALPAGSGKSPVKLIALIIGGLVVLAGIVLAVYFLFFYVSKADYQRAADAYNSLKTTTDDTASDSTGSSLGDQAAIADKLDSQADKILKQYNDMGSLRAVQKDSTVNKAYVDLKQTLNEDVVFVHALAKFMRATDKCGTVTGKGDVSGCVDGLKNLKSDSPAVNDYAKVMAQVYDDYAKGKTSIDTSLYGAATKFGDATKKLTDDNTTKSEALKNAINDKLK